MDSWYTLSILALLLMGTQRFLYKTAAEKGYDTAWTTFSFMATVACLSITIMSFKDVVVNNLVFLVFLALLNSASFFIGAISHIKALAHMPATITYPIIRLNIVPVLVFSILVFGDHLTLWQCIGLICAVVAAIFLTKRVSHQPPRTKIKRGLGLACTSLLCGSVASVSSKYAAIYTDPLCFMASSYTMGVLFAIAWNWPPTAANLLKEHKGALVTGLIMGLTNFCGYYLFLQALTTGPLSIIASITGMHFVISVVMSSIIYKEKITLMEGAGILLTVLAIILMRF